VNAGKDCEGNLGQDKDIDGSDAALFKQGFGRSHSINHVRMLINTIDNIPEKEGVQT